jgi:hypothetical protein
MRHCGWKNIPEIHIFYSSMLHCNIATSFPDNVPEKSGLRAWTGTAHSPPGGPYVSQT